MTFTELIQYNLVQCLIIIWYPTNLVLELSGSNLELVVSQPLHDAIVHHVNPSVCDQMHYGQPHESRAPPLWSVAGR